MATIDNFEGYSAGDLNGQGGWSGDTSFDVQTSVVNTGSNAIEQVTGSGDQIDLSYSAAASGIIDWYFRFTNTNSRRYVLFSNGSNAITYIGTRNGNIEAYHSGGQATIVSASADTWYHLEFEWNGTTFRARADGGTWTADLSPFQGSNTQPDKISLRAFSSPNGTGYWDDISDNTAGGITLPQFLGYAGL